MFLNVDSLIIFSEVGIREEIETGGVKSSWKFKPFLQENAFDRRYLFLHESFTSSFFLSPPVRNGGKGFKVRDRSEKRGEKDAAVKGDSTNVCAF